MNVMAGPALANRGRVTGSLLVLLGAWGALVPFIGFYLGFAYTPDRAWVLTSGRLWLSVVPGAATLLGGLVVAASDRHGIAGAFIAALGGAWFVVGRPVAAFALASRHITPGSPVIPHASFFSPAATRFVDDLVFSYGLGVLILFFASVALGEVIVARMAARRLTQRLSGGYDPAFDRTDQFRPTY
jgi:hypothetical protein